MNDTVHLDAYPRPVAWSEVDRLQFPTRFTAVVDYFATGEGVSRWIVMGQANSAEDVRASVLEHLDSYSAIGSMIWPSLHVPEEFRDWVPVSVQAVCGLVDEMIGVFEYSSRFHRNLA